MSKGKTVKNHKLNIGCFDWWITFAALLYIVLPIIIFSIAFLRPVFCIITIIFFAFLMYKVLSITSPILDNACILNKKTLIYIVITALIFCVWIYFSGIGSFSFQNWDHWVRNPIYNDIINKSWPIYYNLGLQSESVQALIGGEWVAFAYYFTYWLTPAAVCKLFGFAGGSLASRIILFIYTLIGVMIVNYLLCRLFRRFSYKITLLFMGFSGLDVIGYLFMNHKLPALTSELEWSLLHYQLTGNTSQLYYVFNQSIPIWIIMLLLLNINAPSVMAAVAAICFAYSPWATIGLVPIVILGMVKSSMTAASVENSDTVSSASANKNGREAGAPTGYVMCCVKNCISLVNIAIPALLLIVYGLYYSASGGSTGGKGLYFFTTETTLFAYIIGFVVFVLTEYGLFYLAMGRGVLRYRYSVLVFIELTLFPLFYIVDFNFFIRGTIPALFILMVITMSYLLGYIPDSMRSHTTDQSAANTHQSDKTENQLGCDADTRLHSPVNIEFPTLNKRILAGLLIIGALTSVIAFTRSAIYTVQGKSNGTNYLQSDIETFDDMSNANEYQILTTNSQFFVHGFATKPFYLYISKRGL